MFSTEDLTGGTSPIRMRPWLSIQLIFLAEHDLFPSLSTVKIADAGISQFIPVKPNTQYEFSAEYRTEELDTASGPRLRLQTLTAEPPTSSPTIIWARIPGAQNKHDSKPAQTPNRYC